MDAAVPAKQMINAFAVELVIDQIGLAGMQTELFRPDFGSPKSLLAAH
jgi:hypothetical protein